MANLNYVGQTIDGRYLIVRLLGKGGMGSVYLAKHILIGKHVAIKFLHAAYAEREDGVKRFFREAQAAAKIGHKNIINVMDVGVSGSGEPFLVMEFLEGESLAALLKRTGPIDLATALGIMEPALLALAAAHEKGIVHRDLKPDNIFLVREDGDAPTVKLIDFGISKFTQEGTDAALTKTGSPLGTPSYMSPEQIRGDREIDHRTDLYAIGVIFYELLTGGLPFPGKFYNEVLINVLTTEPRPPSEAYSSFPREAEDLVLKLLSKDPALRYQDAEQLLDAMRGLKGFDKRVATLTQYYDGVTRTALPDEVTSSSSSGSSDSGVAAEIYAHMAGVSTAGETESVAIENSGRSKLLIAVVVACVVVVGIVGGIMLSGKDQEEKPSIERLASRDHGKEQASIQKKKTPEENGVQFSISGAPADAKVYYDDFLVMENPFQVKRGRTIVQLRVEAEGFRPYKVSVVPSKDRQIKVEMNPIVKEPLSTPAAETAQLKKQARAQPEPQRKQTGEKKSPRPKKKKTSSKKDFSRAGRGTVVAEGFE